MFNNSENNILIYILICKDLEIFQWTVCFTPLKLCKFAELTTDHLQTVDYINVLSGKYG